MLPELFQLRPLSWSLLSLRQFSSTRKVLGYSQTPTSPESFEGSETNTGGKRMQEELGHFDGLDSVPLRSQGTRGRSERLADPSHYRVEEAKCNFKVKVSLPGAGGRPREPWPRGMGGSGFTALELSAQEQFIREGPWGLCSRCQRGPSEQGGTPPPSVCHIVPTAHRESTSPSERLPS